VFRQAGEVSPNFTEASADVRNADLALLKDAGEIDLIKKLASFPVLIEGAVRAHEPHRLAFYLYELASIFHAQWTAGNELPHLRIIQASDGSLTASRLALALATTKVLASGLEILGVHAPDEMR
jgi:arginyl-tRNA synthetase